MLGVLGLTVPDHGDRRLNERQMTVMERLAERPRDAIPHAMATEAEAEAYYRFIRNPRVEAADILQPHFQAVTQETVGKNVLVVHDTTPIQHSTAAGAADTYALSNGPDGYNAHFSLVVEDEGWRPVGLIGCHIVERIPTPSRVKPNTHAWYRREHEGLRWHRQALAAEEALLGAGMVVHIMDSEADRYRYVMDMLHDDLHVIVRVQQNRRVRWSSSGPVVKLYSGIPDPSVTYEATIEVNARKGSSSGSARKKKSRNALPRKQRTARVEVRAAPVAWQRTLGAPPEWRDALSLHVVHVAEIDPPAGEEAIEWWLWTTEPIEEVEDVQWVVSSYRRRWLIEELRKALKTGCQFEKRRYESRATSTRALALVLPVAARLLALRTLADRQPRRRSSEVLTRHHLLALRHAVPTLPRDPTVGQALMAVARLGGHQTSNGTPGWSVLGRGLQDLELQASVWIQAEQHFAGNKM